MLGDQKQGRGFRDLILTEKGFELCESLQNEIQSAMSSLILDLSPNQFRQLASLLDVIKPGEEPQWSDGPDFE